ncbi:hypothetical protein [uncultured Phenylobacterium sp.]|uniref:hypothetical protein n=1 Tax=uncultured Phenylobacterium sp. TaxID=349273 RepID=UPI0025F75644|nr:hypothetical protein [uncultured Phenylobacterium sp.]
MAQRTPNAVQASVGLVVLVAGLGAMTALVVVAYGGDEACQAWALRLGLTLSLVLSAAAQSLVLLGGWMLWRSGRRMR